MSTLGKRLRAERESKGLGRVDVARSTKVAVHHLAALEYGDFADLPDAVHTKGYVRAYAEYLGLDPAVALAEFLEEYGAACPEAVEDHRDDVVRQMSKMLGGPRKPWVARFRPALIPAAAVLIVALGLFGLSRVEFGGARTQSRVTEPTTSVAEPTAAEASPGPEPPTLEAVAVAPPDATVPPPVEPPARREEPRRQPPNEPSAPRAASPRPANSTSGAAGLSIRDHGVGAAVESLQLKGESDRFAVGERVWFWTRVLGARSGETIRHVWKQDGRVITSIPLTLGSANWRTYSRKTMYEGSVGSWVVEAVDADGIVLARSEFVCTP